MSKLVVIFPGVGYTTDKPLLYFSRKLAGEAGFAECISVKYESANKENIRGNLKAMQETFEMFYVQVKEQLADVDWNKYDDVLFISKSIGTIIATTYAYKEKLTRVRHILYTPLTFTYECPVRDAIAFIGTKDAWSEYSDVVSKSNEQGIPIEIYENCNHSLETDDAMENLDILKDVMDKTKEFIG